MKNSEGKINSITICTSHLNASSDALIRRTDGFYESMRQVKAVETQELDTGTWQRIDVRSCGELDARPFEKLEQYVLSHMPLLYLHVHRA